MQCYHDFINQGLFCYKEQQQCLNCTLHDELGVSLQVEVTKKSVTL